MSNEPIAWGFFDDDGVIYDCVTNQDYCGENGKPLYTHPTKTLTDEEIMELWYPFDRHSEAWVEDSVLVDFARAILKKASEK
jgi:hypothetical protein